MFISIFAMQSQTSLNRRSWKGQHLNDNNSVVKAYGYIYDDV